MHRLSVLVLLLSLPLSGCIQGPEGLQENKTPSGLTLDEIQARLSQPVYEVTERMEAVVESEDDTQIWLDIFFPADAHEPVPVILEFTPYRIIMDAWVPSCTEIERQKCPLDPELVDFFVPRGYAVAFADVAGNHNSGGCADLLGPETRQHAYDVVEWLAAQPWSNDRVGMIGGSFDGAMEIAAAVLNPPSLVTIVPSSATTDRYGYYFYGGVPYSVLQGSLSSAAFLTISTLPGVHSNALTTYPERVECQPRNLEAGLDQSGDWSPYWEERDLSALTPQIRASVLQLHGFTDWNVKPDHVDPFWNNLTTEKRLILGQWGHQYPTREDWTIIRHRWFDHYLKGINTGILEDLPPVLIESDAGEWRGLETFPPLDAETITLYPSADGTLKWEPPAEGTFALRDYPRGGSGNFGAITSTPGEVVTGDPRLLEFDIGPFEEDLHYTGRPYVHLVASTDAKSTHWAVRLIELDEAGQPITTGEYGGEALTRGFLDTRHRNGVKNPQDLPPDEKYEGIIKMYPQDDVIEKGHTLRLVLNNNDNFIHQDTTFARSTVYFGPNGTKLVIPLAPAGTPVPADALRPELQR